MSKRENLASRLGFILLSAGCAIGLGNVWRFPYMTGQYGGGYFVLIYLLFLFILGVPVLTMEYAIGRASRKSILPAYQELEKPGHKWHWIGYPAMLGNYALVMFYSVIAGWILYYFYQVAVGHFENATSPMIMDTFSQMMASPQILVGSMLVVMILTTLICSIGLQKGVEKITKIMMIVLLAIMVVLAIQSVMLPGASKGIDFYLGLNWDNVEKAGLWNVIYAAMNQAFFTLSVGMGGMEIFGSYIDKKRSLTGEAVCVAFLDTFVAITAGLIIFPTCFAYGISPDAGPSLIFLTLPHVFIEMPFGRLWGTMFFLFLFCAALSTMVGVVENVISFSIDILGANRRKAAIVNGILLAILSIPCALGFNLWADFEPLRAGNCIMDLEDFFVSNFCLPFGSFIAILFCTGTYGWGFKNYLSEVNSGTGLQMPSGIRFYLRYILPACVGFLFVYGIVTYF